MESILKFQISLQNTCKRQTLSEPADVCKYQQTEIHGSAYDNRSTKQKHPQITMSMSEIDGCKHTGG